MAKRLKQRKYKKENDRVHVDGDDQRSKKSALRHGGEDIVGLCLRHCLHNAQDTDYSCDIARLEQRLKGTMSIIEEAKRSLHPTPYGHSYDAQLRHLLTVLRADQEDEIYEDGLEQKGAEAIRHPIKLPNEVLQYLHQAASDNSCSSIDIQMLAQYVLQEITNHPQEDFCFLIEHAIHVKPLEAVDADDRLNELIALLHKSRLVQLKALKEGELTVLERVEAAIREKKKRHRELQTLPCSQFDATDERYYNELYIAQNLSTRSFYRTGLTTANGEVKLKDVETEIRWTAGVDVKESRDEKVAVAALTREREEVSKIREKIQAKFASVSNIRCDLSLVLEEYAVQDSFSVHIQSLKSAEHVLVYEETKKEVQTHHDNLQHARAIAATDRAMTRCHESLVAKVAEIDRLKTLLTELCADKTQAEQDLVERVEKRLADLATIVFEHVRVPLERGGDSTVNRSEYRCKIESIDSSMHA
jgi:hypothetical protein